MLQTLGHAELGTTAASLPRHCSLHTLRVGSLAESGQLQFALAPALITKGANEKIHSCQELGRVTEKLFCILQWIIRITIHLPHTQNFYNPKGLPYVRYNLWLKMVFCVDSQTVRRGGKVDCG